MRRWSTAKPMIRETLLALLVLAIAFLNFGHGSVAVAADGHVSVTALSVCGDPIHAPGDLDHSPCHACRMGGGADLPPTPLGAEPVEFIANNVAYATALQPRDVAFSLNIGNARAPPAV